MGPLSKGEAQGIKLEQAVGCSGAADKLACMRTADAKTVVMALPTFDQFRGTGASWGPLVDGVVFPEPTQRALSEGAYSQVPTIIGSNKDEGALFVWGDSLLNIDASAYAALLTTLAPQLGSDAATLLPTATPRRPGRPTLRRPTNI